MSIEFDPKNQANPSTKNPFLSLLNWLTVIVCITLFVINNSEQNTKISNSQKTIESLTEVVNQHTKTIEKLNESINTQLNLNDWFKDEVIKNAAGFEHLHTLYLAALSLHPPPQPSK